VADIPMNQHLCPGELGCDCGDISVFEDKDWSPPDSAHIDTDNAEAGTKTCNPGRRRKTTAGGGFVHITPENTSESSSQTPRGDGSEGGGKESPSRGNGNGKRPAENPVPQQSEDSGKEEQFACPYYKNSPSTHQTCSGWSSLELHRVK